MKKLRRLLLILFFIIPFACISLAQVSKGQWMVGGYANISPDRYLSINISPTAGYLISNKIAVGAMFNIDYANSDIAHYISNYLIPTGRYYFGKTRTQLFIMAGFGMAHQTSVYKDDAHENNSDFSYYGGGALGLSHFVNNNIALEVMVGYSNSPITRFRGIFVNFGLQIILNKKTYEEE